MSVRGCSRSKIRRTGHWRRGDQFIDDARNPFAPQPDRRSNDGDHGAPGGYAPPGFVQKGLATRDKGVLVAGVWNSYVLARPEAAICRLAPKGKTARSRPSQSIVRFRPTRKLRGPASGI